MLHLHVDLISQGVMLALSNIQQPWWKGPTTGAQTGTLELRVPRTTVPQDWCPPKLQQCLGWVGKPSVSSSTVHVPVTVTFLRFITVGGTNGPLTAVGQSVWIKFPYCGWMHCWEVWRTPSAPTDIEVNWATLITLLQFVLFQLHRGQWRSPKLRIPTTHTWKYCSMGREVKIFERRPERWVRRVWLAHFSSRESSSF